MAKARQADGASGLQAQVLGRHAQTLGNCAEDLDAIIRTQEGERSGWQQQVGEALDLLYTDDGFDAACRILAGLTGRSTAKYDLLSKVKGVDITKLAGGPEQPFTAKITKKRFPEA